MTLDENIGNTSEEQIPPEDPILIQLKMMLNGTMRHTNINNASGDEADKAKICETNYEEQGVFEVRQNMHPYIQRALEKKEEGTYGICDGCDKKIPKKRMEAVIYAVYCVKCQDDPQINIFEQQPRWHTESF
jgi:RNA polymerase-binding transcription factor DksA